MTVNKIDECLLYYMLVLGHRVIVYLKLLNYKLDYHN